MQAQQNKKFIHHFPWAGEGRAIPKMQHHKGW